MRLLDRFKFKKNRGRNDQNFDHLESLEDLPANQRTSQQAVDTERPAFFFDERLVLPPFDLSTYLDLYIGDSLAKAIVDADTHLTCSPLECCSESDDLCEYVHEFHRRIDLEPVIWQLCRDANLFGFSIAEIVGNGSTLIDSSEILGIKRLDPRFILIQKDDKGRFTFFRQRPGFSPFGNSPLSFEQRSFLPVTFDRPLDPESIVYICNRSPFSSYGHSVLQSLNSRLTQRNQLIAAAVQAARNHANPVNHLHYQVDPELPEDKSEIDRQRRQLREQVKRVDKGETRWLVSGGRGTYVANTLGHTTLPSIVDLLDRVTQDVLVAAGHSPSSLGMTISAKGVTTIESAASLSLNMIQVKQRNVVNQLKKLYRLLPLIERETPSGEIIVKMEEPTSETMKEKQEANAIRLNNALLAGKAGIISGEQAARELGYHDLDDPERWDAMTQPMIQEQNPNDPNDAQQQRAALAQGKEPGNNPKGTNK